MSYTTPTATVATRVRELREKRGWSARELAERCATAGAPHLDRSIIANIESGRRRSVSVEELLVFAYVLDVAPVHLLVPVVDDVLYAATPDTICTPTRAREWVRGKLSMTGLSANKKIFFTEVPEDEWQPPGPPPRMSTSEEIRAFLRGGGLTETVEPAEDGSVKITWSHTGEGN